MRQLLLPLHLQKEATFENFYCGNHSSLAAIVRYLQHPSDALLFLCGKPHCGLTHLLQATCHFHEDAAYFSLKKYIALPLEENTPAVIALDDIDAIAGFPVWEEALFHLFNQQQQAQKCLIIASHQLPSQLHITLPDLKSRLQSMLLLTIETLSDSEKLKALQLRAKQRGFVLTDEVGKFLLHHAKRDMTHLFQLLDQLDHISLEEKRKLSVPLVKKYYKSL